MPNYSINIQNLPIPLIVSSPQGKLLAINDKARRLLRYHEDITELDNLFDFSRTDLHDCQSFSDIIHVMQTRNDEHKVLNIPYGDNTALTHLSLHFQSYPHSSDQHSDHEIISIALHDVSENKKLINAFEYKEDLLENIISTSSDAFIVFDQKGHIEMFNSAAEHMFGHTSAEMIIEDIFCLFTPGSHQKIEKMISYLNQTISSNETFILEEVFPITSANTSFPATITVSRSSQEENPLYFMVVSDKSVFHRFVNSVNDAYIKTDCNGIILEINNKTEALFHYDRDTLINKHIRFLELTNCNSNSIVTDVGTLIDQCQDDEDFITLDKRGNQLILNLTVWPQEINNMRINNIIIRDISQKKLAEQKLIASAFTDSLTLLSNRANFIQELKKLVSLKKQSQNEFALLVIDIDKFKAINESFGNEYGDELLMSVAGRLLACVRKHDLVSRMGSDEFTLIIQHLPNIHMITEVADRLLRNFRRDFLIKDKRLSISASIGIALFPEDAHSAEDLYKAADMAMYSAKRDGKDKYHRFTRSMHQRYERQKIIERSLLSAIENNEFSLYFQPKISFSQNRLAGFEALLRWQHPDLGFLSPDEFIPNAEESNTIIDITRWVLNQSMQLMNEWESVSQAFRRHKPSLAVNISPEHFQNNLFNDLQDSLYANRFNPGLLEIEITESTLLNHSDDIIRCINDIRELGVHISLDDFGTGYSSLQYLKHFKLNAIKIDRSFVKDMIEDSHNNFIIESIISIANRLGLDLVAEGVETREQLEHLVSLGCDTFQGFYYSKPIPSKNVFSFVETIDERLKQLNAHFTNATLLRAAQK